MTLVTVLTASELTDYHVLKVGGHLFAVIKVRGSDTAGVGFRVEARAIDDPASLTFLETSNDESPFADL